MTYKIECENPLLKEFHVIVNDITSMPIIIEDKMITELSEVWQDLFITSNGSKEKEFKVIPSEAQEGDWNWETQNGQMIINGKLNLYFTPCSLDFWMR